MMARVALRAVVVSRGPVHRARGYPRGPGRGKAGGRSGILARMASCRVCQEPTDGLPAVDLVACTLCGGRSHVVCVEDGGECQCHPERSPCRECGEPTEGLAKGDLAECSECRGLLHARCAPAARRCSGCRVWEGVEARWRRYDRSCLGLTVVALFAGLPALAAALAPEGRALEAAGAALLIGDGLLVTTPVGWGVLLVFAGAATSVASFLALARADASLGALARSASSTLHKDVARQALAVRAAPARLLPPLVALAAGVAFAAARGPSWVLSEAPVECAVAGGALALWSLVGALLTRRAARQVVP